MHIERQPASIQDRAGLPVAKLGHELERDEHPHMHRSKQQVDRRGAHILDRSSSCEHIIGSGLVKSKSESACGFSTGSVQRKVADVFNEESCRCVGKSSESSAKEEAGLQQHTALQDDQCTERRPAYRDPIDSENILENGERQGSRIRIVRHDHCRTAGQVGQGYQGEVDRSISTSTIPKDAACYTLGPSGRSSSACKTGGIEQNLCGRGYSVSGDSAATCTLEQAEEGSWEDAAGPSLSLTSGATQPTEHTLGDNQPQGLVTTRSIGIGTDSQDGSQASPGATCQPQRGDSAPLQRYSPLRGHLMSLRVLGSFPGRSVLSPVRMRHALPHAAFSDVSMPRPSTGGSSINQASSLSNPRPLQQDCYMSPLTSGLPNGGSHFTWFNPVGQEEPGSSSILHVPEPGEDIFQGAGSERGQHPCHASDEVTSRLRGAGEGGGMMSPSWYVGYDSDGDSVLFSGSSCTPQAGVCQFQNTYVASEWVESAVKHKRSFSDSQAWGGLHQKGPRVFCNPLYGTPLEGQLPLSASTPAGHWC